MTPTPLTAWIEGVGFIAPGLPDWASACAVFCEKTALTAAASILPVPGILPPAERRRASRVVKLALAIGLEAAAHAEADVSTLATVSTTPCTTPRPATGASPPRQWRRAR